MPNRPHWWTDIHRNADANLRLGCALALAGLALILALITGLATTAWSVNWSLRQQMRRAYARPAVL